MKPRFVHDCDNCTFIGQTAEYDLYVCPQGTLRTIIGRYGNDGPDYVSGGGVVFIETPMGRIRMKFEEKHLG